MNQSLLNGHCLLIKTTGFVRLDFPQPFRVLSSAVLNGGLGAINHLLNLRVKKHGMVAESPAETLAKTCRAQGLSGSCIGMMTAASMSSLRIASTAFGDVQFTTVVTSGLANVLRAGDPTETHTEAAYEPGTINLVLLTNANLTNAAMVEALTMATEAKVAALDSLNIISPLSQRLATGTGTDATAVVSNPDGKRLDYVGKHLPEGEMLAQTVIEALQLSLAYDIGQPDN